MKSLHRYLLGLCLALGLLASSYTTAQAFIGISVNIAPPPLPVYVQPACPGPDYLWTPGYWAWDADDEDYYWVPGSWVLAPEFGLLWTPCWWGWSDGAYCFHQGYWGHDVGFYGGINYGFGYDGRGYDGGHWHGHHFFYNRAVNNVAGIDRARTFSHAVAVNGSRTSFNGGAGGVNATADPAEQRAASEHHFAATSAQNNEVRTARTDPSQRFHTNHGAPQVTGTARAGNFRGAEANAATGESRTSGESALTGENRHASATGGDSAFTGENRHASATGETAFTGGNRSASAGTEERHAEAATQERHAEAVAEQRRVSQQRSASAEREFAEPSHVSSYHAAEQHSAQTHVSSYSHPGSLGGGGGGFAHAPAVHMGGGGGFAHAPVAHAGGGGGGGAAHAAGGGHPGGAPGHH